MTKNTFKCVCVISYLWIGTGWNTFLPKLPVSCLLSETHCQYNESQNSDGNNWLQSCPHQTEFKWASVMKGDSSVPKCDKGTFHISPFTVKCALYGCFVKQPHESIKQKSAPKQKWQGFPLWFELSQYLYKSSTPSSKK